jgi:RND family efflux transporter MFP subunit
LQQAEIQAARYVIKAPMSGTVMQRSVDPGQLVDPATPLFTLADLATLVVETDVDEAYATQIKTGLAATMQLVGTSDSLAGRVSFVAPRVDPATGGLAVKIGFDVPLSAPVGLTVTANIVVDARQDALTVPRTALVTEGEGWSVFVVQGGKVQRRAVKVIDWPAARLIVTEGLQPGDPVAVDATGLVDGQIVTQAAP